MEEARRLLQARNDTESQPHFNLALARVYMNGADPKLGTRTWQEVMEHILEKKSGETHRRWEVAIKDKNFDFIRNLPVAETIKTTQPNSFGEFLKCGTARRDQRTVCYAAQASGRPRPPLDPACSAAQTARSSRAVISIVPQERWASVCGSAAALRCGFVALDTPLRLRSTFPAADRRPKPQRDLSHAIRDNLAFRSIDSHMREPNAAFGSSNLHSIFPASH